MFFTGLMVILTIFGQSSLAAEVGLTYSIIASVNLIFSYNLKNQILLDNNKFLAEEVYNFRIFLSIFVFIILIYVINNFDLNFSSEILIIYTAIIIFQNWLIEIILIKCEIEKKYNFFKFYNLYQSLNFLILIFNLFFFQNDYINQIFFFIITINFLIIFKNKILNSFKKFNFFKLFNEISKLFAFTSSISVILSVISWRVFIYFNFDKEIAGILFTSFALGSFVGTIFSSSIAPSIMKKNIKYKKYLNMYFILCFCLSSLVFLSINNFEIIKFELNENNILLINCSIFSILGSSIIIFAIARRINFYNRKLYRNKIYILDIINSIMIACAPIILFYININLIIFSYLLAACFSLIIFSKLLLK